MHTNSIRCQHRRSMMFSQQTRFKMECERNVGATMKVARFSILLPSRFITHNWQLKSNAIPGHVHVLDHRWLKCFDGSYQPLPYMYDHIAYQDIISVNNGSSFIRKSGKKCTQF